jgi:hypothetical protein
MSHDNRPRPLPSKTDSPPNFKYPTWQPQYEAVIDESDLARLAYALAAVEGAIFFRLRAIADSAEHEAEGQAIAEALCVIHNIRRDWQKKIGRKVPSQFPQSSRPSAACHICDKPLSLETAKTDDQGLGVHEECYVARLADEMEGVRHPKKSA